MKPLTLFVFIALICSGFNFAYAQLIGLYNEKWQTIKTAHFDVVVSAKQHDLGLYYALAAEKAYQNLSTVFTHLTERTVIIVNDTTDVTNGYATRIPYPHIMAYAVPVGEHDALSESGDWGRELITHEMTHILQFEPATGLYSWLRPIFGTIVAPNLLTPLWWKEGMAVEMETRFSPRGRLRSTYQDATLRSLVLDKKLSEYTLPQANEVLPTWPYGSRPYLFGSMFFSQLDADTKSTNAIAHLANRQGERVPYFIDEPMREIVGRTYDMEYTYALDQAEVNAYRQIAKIKTQSVSEVTAVPQKGESSFNPRYSEKFKLLAYIENIEGDPRLSIVDENNKWLDLKHLPSGSLSNFDFHPTEKKILYTKIDRTNSHYIRADLWIYDINADKSEQVTKSQRARNPHYSADGSRVVFITTFSGQTQIRTLDSKTNAVQFIINSGYSNRYETAIFWDDQTLLASKVDENGNYKLVRIDLALKPETTLALDYPQLRFLKKVGNSLYFVSSKNGVNNLYVSQDLTTAHPVSNLLNGVWSYDISNNDETTAWGSLMTSTGFKVKKIKLAASTQDLPVIENAVLKRYNFQESTSTPPAKLTTSEYSAGSYLWPSYWIPFISTSSSSKGVYLQAQTAGHDPLNLHQYTLVGSYDSELQKGNFSGIYLNSTQQIPFQLSSIGQSRALGTVDNIVTTTTYAASLLPDMFWLNKKMIFELGVQLQNVNYTTTTEHWGPYTQVAYKNYEQNLHQVSPETGWGGLLKFEKNYKLKDDTEVIAQDYEKASYTLIGFAHPWLPEHHALKARLSGVMTFSSVFGRYGASSSSAFTDPDGLTPQFVMRGYPSAQFFGRSIWNANFEYRFPVSTIERGYGADPYFFRRITGAIIADGLAVEGNGLSENLVMQNLKLNESIWNTGLELKLESTIGYVLPMNFVLGYYIPHSPLYASGSQLGLSLQIGGLDGF
jgi:hypothetical protein